jgi:hypothetical protein
VSDTTCPIPVDQMEAAVLRHAGEKAPPPLRMMAAKGMAPMPPKDLVTTQFVLTFDADEKVRTAAEKSLTELDQRIANAVLGDKSINPHVLGYLAKKVATNDVYAEKILLNPGTPSIAFVAVAAVCSEATAEIVANNQARVLEVPEIARALTKNGNALKSTIDRVIDFLVRSGIVLEGVPEFAEAFLRLTGEERLKAADAVIGDVPLELLDEQFLTDEQKAERSSRRLIEDEEEGEPTEQARRTVEQMIRELTTPQKVALATKGNKTVRSLFMRDTNRLVALAAVTSPAVSESEIISTAQARTVHQEVIAHIAKDKKNNWVRNYQVKVALVNNPKCPLPEAMKLVPTLNPRDLKLVAKSKNVPAGVRNRATQLVKQKGEN